MRACLSIPNFYRLATNLRGVGKYFDTEDNSLSWIKPHCGHNWVNTRALHIPPLLGLIRPQWGGGGLLWEECRALSQDIYWSGNGEIERFSQIRKYWVAWVASVKWALLVSKSYFNKCLILKMSVLCVDIFYEISAQLRHLVWCQLLLVYVVWVARAPCPVSSVYSSASGERKYQICLCPVTSDQMCQIETHYNKQQSAQCYHIHNCYH